MSEGKSANGRAPGFASLLRFLLSSPGPVARSGEGGGDLTAQGGRTLRAGAALVAEALGLGLVLGDHATLSAAPEARSHLRRLLAGGEERYGTQHRDIGQKTVLVGGRRETASVNRLESPLSGLARIRDKAGMAFLPETAISAGERLSADFTRGGLQPRLTMCWEPRIATRTRGDAGAAREIADTALAARERVERAIAAMGPELSGVALDVCCFMKGLETVERERQWPARSAKLLLRAALMALARHYDPPRTPRPRSHAWGADGFRPGAERLGLGD